MFRAIVRAIGLSVLLALLTAGFSQAQGNPAVSADVSVGPIDVSFFYQNLSSDGEWFQSSRYGWVWTPYDLSPDWRPYTNGHWEYTDAGWSWASDEPFGWATYHYGRWYDDDTYGWAWVPGTEWAPAWVAWRSSDDALGWAPLPPSATWDATAGLTFTDAASLPVDAWAYVPSAHALDVDLSANLYPLSQNGTWAARTQDATRYEVRSGRPYDTGVDVAGFETRLGHPVTRVTVSDMDGATHGDGRAAGDGHVGFYRPRVQGSAATTAPPAELVNRASALPDADVQRMRADRQKRFDADLAAEKTRLLGAQDREMHAAGANAEALKKQHAAEQAAFDRHAAQQRTLFQQRMQHRMMRPTPATPAPPGGGPTRGMGSDRGAPDPTNA